METLILYGWRNSVRSIFVAAEPKFRGAQLNMSILRDVHPFKKRGRRKVDPRFDLTRPRIPESSKMTTTRHNKHSTVTSGHGIRSISTEPVYVD